MSNLGETLRQQRESRNITLDMIAAATKIGKRYLLAIEAGEYGDLPGSVFNKGYVREYAKFVGLDPERMVNAYVEEEQVWQEGVIDPVIELSRKLEQQGIVQRSSQGPRPMRIIVPLLAVALVALATWFLFFRGGGVGEPAAAETAAAMTDSAPDSTAAPVGNSQAEEPVARVEPRDPAPTPDAGGSTDSETKLPLRAERESEPPPSARAPAPERQTEPTTSARTVPVEVEPAPAQPSPAAIDAAALSIDEFGVGTRVVNRRLQGENDRFEEGTQVWFWTRVLGGESGESIRHVWLHEGREITSTELTLGGPHWRTQSRKTLYSGSSPGTWTVEARDSEGRLLARDRFTCVPRGS